MNQNPQSKTPFYDDVEDLIVQEAFPKVRELLIQEAKPFLSQRLGYDLTDCEVSEVVKNFLDSGWLMSQVFIDQ